jgi:hypothetical protein
MVLGLTQPITETSITGCYYNIVLESEKEKGNEFAFEINYRF